MGIKANAQGISTVNATLEILPSTYYSGVAWQGTTYIANNGTASTWSDVTPIQGVPPVDLNGKEWFKNDYVLTDLDFSWSKTNSPYSSAATYKGLPSTQWCTDNITADIYIRRSFTITSTGYNDVYLACGRDDGPSEYYINGTLVYTSDTNWNEAEYIKLNTEQIALLKTDGTENVIAIHVHNNFGGAYADCGLYGVPKDAKDLGNLAMGYDIPWTARLLFNPQGGYAFNNTNNENPIHGWEKLYEAQAGDIYTITMPTYALDAANARVQFKTPITINASHKYKFSITFTANQNISSSILSLSENEDDAKVLKSESINLLTNTPFNYSVSNLTGVYINDMKLELDFPTMDDNANIKIENISLYDQTDLKEVWVGTSFYNWCYYADPNTSSRIKDMTIDGRKETLSWSNINFDDSQWQEALMPIGNRGCMPELKTEWPGNENTNYWIRRTFNLDEVAATTKYTLNVCHDDSYTVYVNGHIIDTSPGWTNGKTPTSIEVPSRYLKVGQNVIATYIQQNWGGRFYDCGMSTIQNFYEESDIDGDPTQLEINEIQVDNIDQYIDNSYNYGGWIEIYNKTDKRIALDYLYVSDDETNLKKFMLPNGFGVAPAYGYKAVFFDHNIADGVYGDTAFRQVNFKLNPDGGTIYLSDYDGNLISQATYPAAIARCSYARKDNTGKVWGITGEPTLAASNSTSTFSVERLAEPIVDTDSKLFTDAFSVNVTIPTGATLRYTNDGSAPNLLNGYVSTDGKFDITKTSTLRFGLFEAGKLPSKVVTRSYIYRDNNYYLPVISISTNPDNLYNDTIGVYVDGTNGVEGRNYGKSNINMDWERPVNFEYITPDGKMAVNMEAEFSLSGGWSRHYLPTSFKIKATKMYEGKTSIDYPFFKYKPFNKYKQILIRNGGNDNNSPEHGRVRDAITQETLVSSGFNVDAQAYQPVHVFFNGKYIGQLNLREPSNRYYGTANYGYDDDFMDAFEYSNGYFQMSGTRDYFNELLTKSAGAADDAVYDDICNNYVDIDEFVNFWASITYIGCSDWIGNNNNLKGYRSNINGKFRLNVLDQDWGWSKLNALAIINNNYQNEILTIYNNLKKNPRFQRQLIDAYCILGGSVFTPERCLAYGDSICKLVEPALALEGKQPWTSYNEQKYNMTNEQPRNTRIQTLRDVFGLGAGMDVTLSSNVSQTNFLINKQPVPLNKFSGKLFSPVTIEASAPAGYNFVGWEKMVTSISTLMNKGENWSYWDKGSLDGIDWKSGIITNWSSGNAPLGYGNHTYNTVISYGNDSAKKYPTYYFRRNLTLQDAPTSSDKIYLNWVADDGFVLYVNGVEAARHLMADGTPTYNTFASANAGGNPDFGTSSIDPTLFKKGNNIIAVEVHNNTYSSTDIYWDAGITMDGTMVASTLSTDRVLNIDKDEDMVVNAVFEPINDACLNAAKSTPVVINEVSAGNSIFVNDYYKKNDWIELYNTTSNDIDIAGMYLSDDITLPEKYKISSNSTQASTVIPAHGYLIVWADKLSPLTQLHSIFKLENSDATSVMLLAADKTWADTLTYMAHTGEESVGRYPDGGKRIYKMTKPTIHSANMINTSAQFISGTDSNFDEQGYLTGINKHVSGDVQEKTEYFTVDGIKLNAPQRGLNIVRKTNSDGNVTTRRIVVN